MDDLLGGGGGGGGGSNSSVSHGGFFGSGLNDSAGLSGNGDVGLGVLIGTDTGELGLLCFG